MREEGAAFDTNIEYDQVHSPTKQESIASDSEETTSQFFVRLQGLESRLLERLSTWLKTLESQYQLITKKIFSARSTLSNLTIPTTFLKKTVTLTAAVLDTCAQHIEPSPETLSFLLMYYHSTTIWSSTRLALTETAFDEFTYHFEQIVHHAGIYLNAQAGERLTFTFETGAVAPLFLTTTHCRIPSLRRKALDLMAKAPRKESFHGAGSTAEIASRVIAIEEDGLGFPMPECTGRCALDAVDDSVLPPEDRRVHNLELTKNTTTQRHEMTVTRYNMVNELFVQNVEVFPI